MRISDWSSDVCSSDLNPRHPPLLLVAREIGHAVPTTIARRLAPAPGMRARDHLPSDTCRGCWQMQSPVGRTLPTTGVPGPKRPPCIGRYQTERAHVRTPDTNAHLVGRSTLDHKTLKRRY